MIGSPSGGHNSRGSGRTLRADIGQMLTAPEQLAIDDKARHPEDAFRLGGAANPLQLPPPLPRQVRRKAGSVDTGFFEHRTDHPRVLDVELTLPKALEGQIVIAPQHLASLALGIEHADCGEGRVPDLLRAADHQAALPRLPAAVHIAV